MQNRWLMTLLLAPVLEPASMADPYSLYWYMLEEDARIAAVGHESTEATADSATREPTSSTRNAMEVR